MKILAPVTGRMELTLSAAGAVLVHAAVLGLGLGSFARPPAPRLRQVERSETVSLLPPAPRPRERVKRPPREQVRKEREALRQRERTPEPVVARRTADALRERSSRPAAERRPLHPPERKVHMARAERTPVQERVLREPSRSTSEPTGRQELALLRTAAPRVRKGFSFTYPRFARLMGYEGKVTLEVTVSPEGRVTGVRVVHSSGYRILDESAARQMRSIPFSPALDPRGRPVASTVIQTVDFDLREGRGAEYEW